MFEKVSTPNKVHDEKSFFLIFEYEMQIDDEWMWILKQNSLFVDYVLYLLAIDPVFFYNFHCEKLG